ncbi:MAG: hypothetical protein U1F25_16655 [Rubrivivax sp.]
MAKNILLYTQLGRLIQPEEIADAICFMLTNSAVSGELVDGTRRPDGAARANPARATFCPGVQRHRAAARRAANENTTTEEASSDEQGADDTGLRPRIPRPAGADDRGPRAHRLHHRLGRLGDAPGAVTSHGRPNCARRWPRAAPTPGPSRCGRWAASRWRRATTSKARPTAASPARRTHWPFNVYARAYQNSAALLNDTVQGGRRHRLPRAAAGVRAAHAAGRQLAGQRAGHQPRAARADAGRAGPELVRGMQNWIEDLRTLNDGAAPAGTEAFEVGKQVAATLGKVVFCNDLIELIQYAPTTKTTRMPSRCSSCRRGS